MEAVWSIPLLKQVSLLDIIYIYICFMYMYMIVFREWKKRLRYTKLFSFTLTEMSSSLHQLVEQSCIKTLKFAYQI